MVRKEPTISGLEPIGGDAPKPDSTKSGVKASSAKRPQAQAESASHRTRSASHHPAPEPRETKRAGGSFVAILSLLLTLTVGAGAGYLYQLNQQLQAQVIDSEARLRALEKRLELTGDEATTSMEAVRAKLKWADSEIRKLWGVSHDKNRKSIKANQKSLTSLSSTVEKQKKQLLKAEKDLIAQLKTLEKLKVSLAAAEKNLTDFSALKRQGQENQDKLNSLLSQLGTLERTLEGRIRENEESIEAIDAYRLNHNREFLKLQQRVQQQRIQGP